MYLYEIQKDKLIVYRFSEKEDKAYDYRKNEMKSIPNSELFMKAITGIGMEKYDLLHRYREDFDYDIIPIENINGKYHSFKKDCITIVNKQLLERLYEGKLKNKFIFRVFDKGITKYYLLTKDDYKYLCYMPQCILDEIIQIPESLYKLSLLEKQKFSLIQNRNILEQLALFDFALETEINISEIEKIERYNIANGCYEHVVRKANNDQNVLKLLK